MRAGSWGCNEPQFKAMLPFPRAVAGFCSSWKETPTRTQKIRKLKLISEKKQHFSKKGGTFVFVYDT